jgi:leucine-rich repeat protein SHOC2
LSYNKLTSLPTEIESLVGLGELFVRNNNLTSIPAEIGFLTSLRILDISSNGIKKLPYQMGKENFQLEKS